MTSPDPWSSFLVTPEPTSSWYAGSQRLLDTALPAAEPGPPLWVVVTGGAGQIAGPVSLCERRALSLSTVEIDVRDPGDPTGNVQRIVAAADCLPDGVPLVVGMTGAPTPSWLAAADEVSTRQHGALVLDLDAPDLETWIDAALDRELWFAVRGGDPARAVDALRITARLWGDPDDLVQARRWCRTWACDDTSTAIAHLEALS